MMAEIWSKTFLYFFFLDDEPPKLTCPKDIHVKKTGAADTVKVDWPLPIYEDNSGETVTLFTESVRGSGFRVGQYQVKYEAADRSGNKAYCTFAIVVSGSLRCLFLSRFHRMICMEDFCTNLNSEDLDPLIIIWLTPRSGKINRIQRYDWLPELAKWRPPGITRCVPQVNDVLFPYDKSFSDQACSAKMAGYWQSRSMNTLKKNLTNIQPSWLHNPCLLEG